ncbi:MAG: TIGR04283 family arsenosugar biosynthesis glycosyltransferase [Mariprofundus sp.]
MTAEASIAVIVPVLNEQAALPLLLKRLQGLAVAEVVVVDGGSVDGSRELLDGAGIRWLSAGPGRAAQMNAGAATCEAGVLLFAHSDNVLDATSIAAIKAAMVQPECVGGRFDLRLSGTHPALRMIAWFINLRSRLSGISTGDQCQFVRRSVFERMGGFADLPLMEDIDFSKRLKRLGRIASLRQRVTTSSRRWENDGIINTVLLMWRLRLLYWLGVPAERLAHMYRQAR